jgi:hypothetical protein
VLAHTDDDTDLETLVQRKIQVKSFFFRGKTEFTDCSTLETASEKSDLPSENGTF